MLFRSKSKITMFHLSKLYDVFVCTIDMIVERINLNLQNVYAKHIFGCQQILFANISELNSMLNFLICTSNVMLSRFS